jgi:hypothetical protein
MTSPVRPHIPPAVELAELSDVQLVALLQDVTTAIESCRESIDTAHGTGHDPTGIQRALTVYERGAGAIHRIIRARTGDLGPLPYIAPKPVHSFVSAFVSLKAVNRLVGLLQAEHEAVTRWLETDEPVDGDAVEAAHLAVVEALTAACAEVNHVQD